MEHQKNVDLVNIAVVEDDLSAVELLRGYLSRYAAESGTKEFSLTHFAAADPFLSGYTSRFDLVLLDIMLPDLNGMECARELRSIDPKVPIIFVTNMAQFAVKGYEVDALDFIVKPVVYKDFSVKLDRALRIIGNAKERKLKIVSQNCNYYICISDILYVEIFIRKLVYHTTGGNFEMYATLKKTEESLKGEGFLKCNRSTLVNPRYVTAVSADTVEVQGGKLLLSRSYRKQFLADMDRYNGKRD